MVIRYLDLGPILPMLVGVKRAALIPTSAYMHSRWRLHGRRMQRSKGAKEQSEMLLSVTRDVGLPRLLLRHGLTHLRRPTRRLEQNHERKKVHRPLTCHPSSNSFPSHCFNALSLPPRLCSVQTIDSSGGVAVTVVQTTATDDDAGSLSTDDCTTFLAPVAPASLAVAASSALR